MRIYWNDNTHTKFEKPLDRCEKLGDIGFYNTFENKPVLVLWTNIKFIEL
jgi:hypothetical protein